MPPGNVPGETDKIFDLPGHPAAAKMLATRLIEDGFDTAYAYKPLHHPLGHAFTNAIMNLDYHRKGFDYPIVPFAINCYGRRVLAQRGGLPVFDRVIDDADLDPPAPTPRRLFDMGAATARILARLAVPRGAARLVGLEPRLPHGQEPLPVARHAGRPAHVRGAARLRLADLARLFRRGGRGQRPAGDPELDRALPAP